METHYTKIYSGSFIITQLLISKLEEAGISPVIKEQNESGLDPKIYGGDLVKQLYVHNNELDKAIPVVQGAIAEMEA
ncbi:MAG: DUF2007 domain-containing protein [Flavobacteriaceae bacterium]